MVKLSYYASPIEKENFTAEEMVRMKILFIESPENLAEAMKILGVEDYNENQSIYDYGFILSKVGKEHDKAWVLYSADLDYSYVMDVMKCSNFYDLYEESAEGDVLVFKNIRLREDSIEEDMAYYIELHLETRTPNRSSSEFLN